MDFYQINELACECRNNWGVDLTGSIDVLSVVLNKNKNLTIVFLDMDENTSGACYKNHSQSVIFINSNHTKGRQFFSIAHEIYHLSYDDNDFSICNLGSDDEIEKYANQFASCLIMPNIALNHYKMINNIDKWDLDSIIHCEQYFQISHHALLCRLRYLGEISYSEYVQFDCNVKYNANIGGYDSSLYEPYIGVNYTLGNYIRLVEKVHDKNLISRGKKEEFLLEAYLGDLVYNIP